MYKKTAIILFLILCILIIFDYYFSFFGVFTKYLLSFILICLGIIIYPTTFRFENKIDFMIIPVFGIVIFNVINIAFIKNYTFKINCFNYLLSLFCVLQYLYYFKVKKEL